MVYKINKVCLNCGVCLDRCPATAIIEDDECYVINLETCTECGVCTEVCPVEAIVEEYQANEA